MDNACFYRRMSLRQFLLACAAVSAGLLGVALVAQYVYLLHPCDLCWYQRYPYAAIVVIGGLSGWRAESPRMLSLAAWACAALFALDAGIAWYHSGVEWGIFPGPSACSSSGGSNQTLEEMRAAIMNAPLVPCNQAMARFLGVSMATWNAIAASMCALISVIFLLCRRSRP